MSHLAHFNAKNMENVFSNIFSNMGLKVSLSLASVVGEWAFGKHQEALVVVFLLIVMDTFTGVVKAARRNMVSSRDFFRCATKVMVYFVLMMTASMVDKSLPISMGIPVMYTFLAATEAISILENVGEAGFPVPQALIRILKVMRDENKGEG